MPRKKTLLDAEKLAQVIAAGMQDKKAESIVQMDLRNSKGAVTDFFVICTGTSDTHVQAVADSIEDTVRKHLLEKPWHTEGFKSGQWVLLDYVNVVAHVFLKDNREFYGLEDLWADAPLTKVEKIIKLPKIEPQI
ncbi:MAG: ribosome silencing factor [Sphingobacteriia bacterium]|jgi:ribosome-associated protein|nr:ribosome silencing factor [Sphingobacteriia bacterium]